MTIKVIMQELSTSEENYIKAIYAIEQAERDTVSTNALAEQMQTKASSVTDMVKKLSAKSLITYEKYKGVTLTEEGIAIAIKLIRKHRLWETFLVEKLGFGWDEVHEIAEQLEHIQSSKLTQKLDAFLNYPKFDPHGDPIPNEDGVIHKNEKARNLSETDLQEAYIVIGVSDVSPSFLKYLDKNGINIGSKIKVLQRYDFDQSISIEFNGKEINLSKTAVQNITVIPN
jgi:DtxR family Mn-dependent transcriptional regulator